MSDTQKTTGTFYSSAAQTVLDQILAQFASGDIPETISIAMFPAVDAPSANWSLLNRVTMINAGTTDARTFNQWRKVARFVSKGAKSFHILAPIVRKYEVDSETVDGETEQKQYVSGFRCLPVFRYEDTEGESLPGVQIDEQELPLITRAKEWGLDVKAVPANTHYYGYFSAHENTIALATPSEKTFFHELAHAAHHRLRGHLAPGQDPLQEIVAELSAAALCRMVGKSAADTTGNSFRYIERYAEQLNLNPHKACMRVLSQTQQVLDLILEDTSMAKAA